jgi:hypothetical protein
MTDSRIAVDSNMIIRLLVGVERQRYSTKGVVFVGNEFLCVRDRVWNRGRLCSDRAPFFVRDHPTLRGIQYRKMHPPYHTLGYYSEYCMLDNVDEDGRLLRDGGDQKLAAPYVISFVTDDMIPDDPATARRFILQVLQPMRERDNTCRCLTTWIVDPYRKFPLDSVAGTEFVRTYDDYNKKLLMLRCHPAFIEVAYAHFSIKTTPKNWGKDVSKRRVGILMDPENHSTPAFEFFALKMFALMDGAHLFTRDQSCLLADSGNTEIVLLTCKTMGSFRKGPTLLSEHPLFGIQETWVLSADPSDCLPKFEMLKVWHPHATLRLITGKRDFAAVTGLPITDPVCQAVGTTLEGTGPEFHTFAGIVKQYLVMVKEKERNGTLPEYRSVENKSLGKKETNLATLFCSLSLSFPHLISLAPLEFVVVLESALLCVHPEEPAQVAVVGLLLEL